MISERAFSKSFASFWKELMPLLTPRFVSLFNHAYEKVLMSESGHVLASVPMAQGIRPDMVAEFAFWGAQLVNERKLEPQVLVDDPEVLSEVSRKAFDVVQRYEGSRPVVFHPLSPTEIEEGLALVRNYAGLYGAFPGAACTFCPQFQGSGFLNAAEGDLSIGDTLIEIKTTTRNVSSKDLRQLITYLALDSAAGTTRWSHIGVFNPRRGTLHRAEANALLLRMSGGKPRIDVLNELVSFVQATDLVVDRNF